ncbi:MAG: proline racemase family protein, partial [Thermoplasmata archaeon]|nr:proline racemase family protein [Thermoplasmata archaeon]
VVTATLHEDESVSVENVPAWRAVKAARIDVAGYGAVTGDVAYGGNWFFISEEYGQPLDCANLEQLTNFAWRTRLAVNAQGFPEVDHVILCHGSRNFVLCPGKAYDRSPCGTGTSARLACLAADGRLAENELFTQESFIGSVFRGSYRWLDRAKGMIAPTISGRAFVTSEATLLIDPRDPFCFGVSSPL